MNSAYLRNQLRSELSRLESQGDCNLVRVQELMRSGANANYQKDDDTRLIDIPLLENRLDAVKILVESGVAVNLSQEEEDQDFVTPLEIAAGQGFQEIFDYLAPLTDPWRRWLATMELPSGIKWRFQYENYCGNLILPIARAYLETVETTLSQGVNPNAIGSNGCTMLWTSAHNGYVESVHKLIQEGADINIKNQTDGWTPLMIVVATHKAWISGMHNAQWREDIISQVVENRVETARLLIDVGAEVNAAAINGRTPLMEVVGFEASLDMLELLLQADADVNAMDSYGQSALYNYLANQAKRTKNRDLPEDENAYRMERIRVTELLLEAGSDINILDHFGKQALDYAVQTEYPELIDLIQRAGSSTVEILRVDKSKPQVQPERMLQESIVENNIAVLLEAIQFGADINCRSANTDTALMQAVYFENLDIIRILVENGADVNAQNKIGYSALHIAALMRNKEIFDYLAPLATSLVRVNAEKLLGN